ncbi:MAG: hypothetical protein GX456_03965 [Verrucomicrobia bacterium]|nr:hypothetical protein [Verrucomicrobiota bacterium]
MGVGRREAFGVRQLAAAFFMPRQRVCPHVAPFDLAADPDGFCRAAADAVGVGRREAFGVWQLAAALSSCPNNVSVPIPRHLQTPFACFAPFVVETNRTIGRSFANPLGCVTLFRPAG